MYIYSCIRYKIRHFKKLFKIIYKLLHLQKNTSHRVRLKGNMPEIKSRQKKRSRHAEKEKWVFSDLTGSYHGAIKAEFSTPYILLFIINIAGNSLSHFTNMLILICLFAVTSVQITYLNTHVWPAGTSVRSVRHSQFSCRASNNKISLTLLPNLHFSSSHTPSSLFFHALNFIFPRALIHTPASLLNPQSFSLIWNM